VGWVPATGGYVMHFADITSAIVVYTHTHTHIHTHTHVIIIIVWLGRCWTLPFLRSCSRLDDSALNDRRLPDQYWVVPNRSQRSGARCDAVGLIGGYGPLVNEPHWPSGLDCGLQINWPKNLRMMCVSGGLSVPLYYRNAGPQKMRNIRRRHYWWKASIFLWSCRAGGHVSAL